MEMFRTFKKRIQLSYITQKVYLNNTQKQKHMTEEELQNVPQMLSTKMAAQQELINVLMNQVVDLTMMSKIELGDDVIAEIQRLKAIINE